MLHPTKRPDQARSRLTSVRCRSSPSPTHTTPTHRPDRELHRYLQRRNANAREHARIRSETGIRWGGRLLKGPHPGPGARARTHLWRLAASRRRCSSRPGGTDTRRTPSSTRARDSPHIDVMFLTPTERQGWQGPRRNRRLCWRGRSGSLPSGRRDHRPVSERLPTTRGIDVLGVRTALCLPESRKPAWPAPLLGVTPPYVTSEESQRAGTSSNPRRTRRGFLSSFRLKPAGRHVIGFVIA